MKFDQQQAIYLQVADYMGNKILNKTWTESQRIPSVRDVAAELQVNPNTVMRSFSLLQTQNVITNQRGIGYFVADTGVSAVLKWKREVFIQELLPRFFQQAKALGVTDTELLDLYTDYLAKEGEEK